MTVQNLRSHQFIKDWLFFHARIPHYGCKQKLKLYRNLKDIDMLISPIEKFDRGRCFANKKFHGKEGKFG